MEQWKDIEGFDGRYQISNLGRVKSCSRLIRVSHRGYVGYRKTQEKIMKPCTMRNGYQYIEFHKNGEQSREFVHRLVARAFIPNLNNLPFVNHKDENPSNNNVDNLEWCTSKYNCNYGNRNAKISKSRKGMKFTDEHIENMRKAGKQRVNDEFRQKMREVHLGKKLSDEHKKKIGQSVRNYYKNK